MWEFSTLGPVAASGPIWMRLLQGKWVSGASQR